MRQQPLPRVGRRRSDPLDVESDDLADRRAPGRRVGARGVAVQGHRAPGAQRRAARGDGRRRLLVGHRFFFFDRKVPSPRRSLAALFLLLSFFFLFLNERGRNKRSTRPPRAQEASSERHKNPLCEVQDESDRRERKMKLSSTASSTIFVCHFFFFAGNSHFY